MAVSAPAAAVFLSILLSGLLNTGTAQDMDFCFSGDVRLTDSVEMSEPIGNGLVNETVYGSLEICVNGRYLSICNTSGIDAMDVASRACSFLGYSDGDYFIDNGRDPSIDMIVTSIDCPEFSTYGFSDCTVIPDASTECPVGDDLHVLCQRETQLPSYCSMSLTTEFRTSAYFSLNNGDQYTVGFPLLCIDNILHPFCVSNEEQLQLVADGICSNGEGTPGALLGMSSDYMLDFTPSGSINDFTCANDSDISTCQFIPSDSCFFDYNLVTCLATSSSPCFMGDIYQTDTISISYPSTYQTSSSKIETCSSDGERIDICNDGLLDEASLVSLICPTLGHAQGYVSTMRDDISLSSSGQFAVDIDCTDAMFGFSECTYNTSESCAGVPLVLECFSVCQNGEFRLYNPRSNFTNELTITAIAEVCVDGQWIPFCDDGSDNYDSSDFIAVTICQSLGYAGGDILPSDPVNYGSSISASSLSDVDCPFFFSSFTDCSYNITDDGMCGDTSNRLLIQCTPNPEICFDSIGFASRVDISTPNDFYVIGYPQICSMNDGTYAAVCADILQENEAQMICDVLGYSVGSVGAVYGADDDYRQLLTSRGVYDYTCPEESLGISDCTFNYTSGTGCTDNGGVELLTCSNGGGGSTCSEGVRLSPAGTGNLPNGDSLYIGYLEVCVNGSYEPLCQDAVNMDVVQVACYNSFGPSHIAYSYPVVGSVDDYSFAEPSSDAGVYSIDCSYNQYAMFGACDPDSVVYMTDDGCGLYGGYSVISCQSVMNVPPPLPDPCNYTGEVRLIDQNSISDLGIVGVLEICVNGSFTRVCANDSLADIDLSGLADLACNALGYPSNVINSVSTTSFYSNFDPNVIDYIECPPFANDISMCLIETTNDTECSINLFDAYLTCYNVSSPVIPECFVDGQARINNNVTTNDTERLTITGQLEICVDGQYRPVCGVEEEVDFDVDLSSIVRVACEELGYTDSSYMLGFYGSSPSIDYISCSDNIFLSLLSCNYSTTDNNSTCTDFDSRSSVRITCSREGRCIDGNVRLASESVLPDQGFGPGIGGYVEICVDGEYASVCTQEEHSSVDLEELGRLACYDLGYHPDETVSFTIGLSRFFQEGEVIDDINCPVDADTLSSCSIMTNDTSICAGHSFDAFLQCHNVSAARICYEGDLILTEESEFNYTGDPNLPFITGYPVICRDNEYVPFCDNNDLTVYEARYACGLSTPYSFGFIGSTSYYSPPTIEYDGEYSVVNTTCGFETCSFDFSSEPCERSFAVVSCGIVCAENDTRLLNESTTFTSEGLERLTGIPQVCSDGGWISVCNDGSNDPALPTAICQQDHGYRYGRLLPYSEAVQYSSASPRGTIYVNEVYCPETIDNYFEDCSENLTMCDSGTQYVIECYDYDVCEPGSIVLADSVEYLSPEGYYYTGGYPQICVDDQYVPLCDNTMPGPLELLSICYTAVNLTYGLRGTPSFLSVDPYSAVNATSYVVTEFDCSFVECMNTTVNTNDGCSSYGGYSTVTCAHVCEDNDKRLYNERNYTTDDGLLRVVGIPQTCADGGWESICNDGSNDANLPDLICQDAGYRGGIVVPSNRTLYGSSGPGSFYLTDVTCTDSVDNCTANYTFTDECLSGDYDYTVECFIYEVCEPGSIVLADSVEYLSPEGYYYTGGYPQICVDDQYVPLCDNTMPGPLELLSICYTAVNLTYGLRSTPSFLSVDPYSAVNATSYVVTEFDCSFVQCMNTTVNTNDGCSSYGGYSTVTCAHVCEDNDKRLYNEHNYTTDDGLLRVVGIPQTCADGGWESICNDGSNGANLPDLICQDAGYRGGVVVPSNRTLYGSSGPGSFYLTDVTCTDSVDNCTANYTFTDECLSGDYDYTVECFNVFSSPSFLRSPMSLNVTASSNVSFSCQLSGNPAPQVQWTFIPPSPRQPMQILPTGPYSITTTGDSGVITSTLTISSVELTDAGVYRCSASNGSPVQPSRNAMLLVIVPPTVSLISNTDVSALQENDLVNLTCIESGAYPSLPIVWFRDTTLLLSSPPRVTITDTTTLNMDTGLYYVKSDLIISMASLSDSGSYTCRTSVVPLLNEPVISNALSLNVAVRNECLINAPSDQSSPCVNGYCIDGVNSYFCQCYDGFSGDTCTIPVSTTSAPMFEEQPSDTSVLLGEQASLNCIVTGEPQPTITWYKDGQAIPQQITPTLTILSVETSDRGVYSCSATNSEGTITSEGALLRIENIAQYESFLTLSRRRKRQQPVPDDFPGLSEAKALAEGREVAPNAVIVSLNGYFYESRIQLILTVRTAVNDIGQPITTGVISGLTSLTSEISEAQPNLSFSPIQRFDGCVPEQTSLFGSVQVQWPEIGAGENASVPCPCGEISDSTGVTATRMCQGNFISISEWLTPDDSRCRYDMLSQEICNASAANDGLMVGARVLSNVASSAESFTSDTLGIAAAYLSYLSSGTINQEVAATLVEAIGKMTLTPSSEVESDSANEILQSIDTVINNIPTTNGQASVIEPSIAVSVQDIDSVSYNGLTFNVSTNSDGRLGDNAFSAEGQATVSVDVPSNVLAIVANATRIGFSVQTSDIFFVQQSADDKQSPISVIVSLDIFDADGKVEVNSLQQTIDFTFVVEVEAVCVFWNASLAIWSTDGCSTIGAQGEVKCQCNHLSSFTVLDNSQPTATPSSSTNEPGTSEEPVYRVEPIIIIGAVLSGIIILIAVISHLLSSNQRYSQEGKIIICSHICLVVLYVVLVLTSIASYTDSTGFCGTFSGLFHYMSLVYVMWIFTEGLYYLVKLKYGIGGNSLTRYLFRIMFVTSFALPLVIIIVSAGAGHEYYAVDSSFCRPQSYPFYYGYIIPIGLIYIAGITCFIMSAFIALLSSMKGSEAAFRKQLIRPHVLSAIVLHLIILVAWIFGMVGTDGGIVGGASTATQYIFGFTVMIHAIVLLLLTMFRTTDTRQCWSSMFNCVTGRRGKYNLDTAGNGRMTEDNIYVARKRNDDEGIGLESSGRLSREGSVKKKDLLADDEDTVPLQTAEDSKEAVDTAFFSSGSPKEVKVKEELEAEIGSVIANPSADINEEVDNDKKTDL